MSCEDRTWPPLRHPYCPLSRRVFLGKPTPNFVEAEKAVLEGMEAGRLK